MGQTVTHTVSTSGESRLYNRSSFHDGRIEILKHISRIPFKAGTITSGQTNTTWVLHLDTWVGESYSEIKWHYKIVGTRTKDLYKA